MKILFILLGITLLIFLVIQLFAWRSQRDIETYAYEVEKKFDDFEIRRYEASLFSSVSLKDTGYRNVSGKGFSMLAGYIFGGNDQEEKIAMTSPVAISLDDTMRVMFMVPKKKTLASLPKPNQTGIEFVEEPEKGVAAITFGGWANDEKIAAMNVRLIAALDAAGIAWLPKFYFLGYNPPYEVFNRKNELIVELPSP